MLEPLQVPLRLADQPAKKCTVWESCYAYDKFLQLSERPTRPLANDNISDRDARAPS